MTRIPLLILLVLILCCAPSYAYINYELTDSGSVLPSNSVIDIRSVGDTVWIASTRGVGRTDDGGSTWI
ncbi:MAG: hypothetical protein GY855_00275, partial [candidate division Zixibacteria bacterium]|nr:hypothetical protein [candidate division Zixibacteria bacterium]